MLFLADDHFAGAAVEAECKTSPVVQKEQGGVCLYVAEIGREMPAVFFLMYRADAEFVADAVFGAHEFGSAGVIKFISLVDSSGSGHPIDLLRQSVGDVLFICD